MRTLVILGLMSLAMVLIGCASAPLAAPAPAAATPGGGGGGANMQLFVSSDARRPAVTFPAVLAVARVQASGDGQGGYRVVFANDQHPQRPQRVLRGLGELPKVRRVVRFDPPTVPAQMRDGRVLREAARRRRADVLLVYTLDTRSQPDRAGTVGDWFTLGLLHDRQPSVTTAASAMLLDARSGYLYGLARGHARKERRTSYWGIDKALEEARESSERGALDKLLVDVKRTWTGIVGDYGARSDPSAAR